MAAQIFEDPYLFDMLGTADPRREAEVARALVAHVEKFLLELGAGFAFVGRQVPLEVGESDFKVDLLFYHFKLHCFVVVELKAVPFEAAFVGQLNLYLSAADDLLKQPEDNPTIVCSSAGQDKIVAVGLPEHLEHGDTRWKTRAVDLLEVLFRRELAPEPLAAGLEHVVAVTPELAHVATFAQAPEPQHLREVDAARVVVSKGKSNRLRAIGTSRSDVIREYAKRLRDLLHCARADAGNPALALLPVILCGDS